LARRLRRAILRLMQPLAIAVRRCALRVALLCALVSACAAGQNRPLQLVAGAGPAYPEAARREQVEGYVVVRYDVNGEGQVTNVEVLESSPDGVFDDAAQNAVASWRYSPRLVGGTPQPVEGVTSTLRFALDDDGRYDDY